MQIQRRGPNQQRSEATRRELVVVARRLFVGNGYAAVSPADIVAAAGVTKGALYHHFASKPDVLAAVIETMQRELRVTVLRATRGVADPWDRLATGCIAYLRAVASTPGLHRLLYADGVAVLGWSRWRNIDERYWSAELRAAAVEAVGTDGDDADAVAAIVTGTLNHAALGLGPGTGALRRAEAAINLLVTRLR